jgi:hypothetical protein
MPRIGIPTEAIETDDIQKFVPKIGYFVVRVIV